MPVTVDLELDHCCIQTAARREHGRLVACLLDQAVEDRALQARVDLLAEFLATTDFRRLRAEQPRLAGGESCRVTLERAATGEPRWQLVGPRPIGGGAP